MQGIELLRKCANIFWFGNILYILRTLFDDIYFSELAMQLGIFVHTFWSQVDSLPVQTDRLTGPHDIFDNL